MKKLFKNSYIALAVLALGFSACTEQVEYTPAAVPATDQVYFSNANATKMDIAKEATSFDVYVSRIATDGAASIPVTVEADSLANTLFVFPEYVEFADSMATAVYTVSVKNGAVLEYEQYSSISLSISEEVGTPYGNSTFTFQVGVPAPWSDWTKINTDSYTYTGSYWSGTLSGAAVYYREYLLNDVDAQFCLPGMAGGFDLTIEYNRQTGACQVLPQQVATNSTYGPVFVCDLPHYPHQEGLSYEDYPCTFDTEKGLFSLYLIYCVNTAWGSDANGQFGNAVETIQLDGYKVDDFSFAMEFKGHYVDAAGTDNAVISTVKGADVAKYLMTVISADEDANATVQGMLAGTVPCDTLTEVGFFAYPIAESGNYKVLAITFDAEDNAIDAHATDFEFFLVGEDSPWESLGYAVYTEDCLTTFFDVQNESYKVEVREHKDQPGLYRVIHPYGAYGADTSKEYFFEIDATDPEGVYIPGVYGTGLDAGYGEVSITSLAYYYMAAQGATHEDVKGAGYCGVLADNVITFPAKTLLVSMAAYKDGALYTANTNGAFKLDMSNMTETAEAPAARRATCR